MFGLCKYKDMFGKIGKGVHSYRIFGIAIMDVIFTILAAYIIHLSVAKYSFIYILMFLFGLGIVLHRIYCVRTPIDKFLFPVM